jgi:membrane protein required for colicin V production
MSIADIVVAVVVLLSGLIAFRLGLMRVIFGLAAWVGASFATIYGFSYARPFAREWIGNELFADIAAGAGIFVVSMIVLTFLSHTLAGGVRDSGFGMLDRTLGLVAGLAIGGVVISGAYIFSQQFFEMDDNSDFFKSAKTLPLVRRGATTLISLAPNEWGLNVSQPAPSNRDGTFRNLLSPRPEAGGADRKSGYNKDERQEMDRLIRSHQ